MRRSRFSTVLCLVLFVSGEAAAAGFDIFMRAEGLAGDSRATNYVGWIAVENMSVGHGLAPSAGTVGARPLVLTKRVDRSSTGLAAAAASGARMKSAVLDVLRSSDSGMQPVYRVILHDVAVRSYSIAASLNNVPMENVELGYSKIEWYQFSLAADGTSLIQTQAKFDFARNLPYQ